MTVLELQRAKGNFSGEAAALQALITQKVKLGLPFGNETTLGSGRRIWSMHMPSPDGGWVATHEDVTERRRIEAQLEHDSLHDALTELPNRRFLDRELNARKAGTGQNSGLGLLHIDIDRFKQINDTMGHTAGDAVLRHVASVLKGVVSPTDFVARVGGDEFVVVCRFAGEDSAVVGLAQAIIAEMRTPFLYGGGHLRVGVSIGLAVESPPIIDAERLLVSADLALNQAKVGGRGRFERYDPAMLVRIVNSRQMTDELILAVERKEFVTHFQPKVDAQSRAIVGVEALVRWQHPRLGLLPPSQFLTIAEELNLLAEIDDFVLTETLGQLSTWHEQGLAIHKASVNISSRRLRDPELSRRLTELNIPQGAISFELLESIDLDHLDDVVSWNIEQARELGIGIEVDDFGTGRASMLALSRLRPDKLKIDRQFVSAMRESAEQQKLVGWMIEIAHALGVTVIAEGVEDLRQAELLTAMGCDELQGYAFGRPMTGDQLTTLLTAGAVPSRATA